MSQRSIKNTHSALRDDIHDLVTQRPLPNAQLHHLDPFLFLNHHGPQIYPPHNMGLPFGPHPHRGFSTLTFIFEGMLAHQDSAGHEQISTAGGVQWMTAGRGIVHSELSPAVFRREGGPLEILQLWINLPAHLKMCDPFYKHMARDDLKKVSDYGHGVTQYIICDTNRTDVPIKPPITLSMSWLECHAHSDFHVTAPSSDTIFFYIVRGEIKVNGMSVSAFTLVEFENDHDVIHISTQSDAIIIFGHGPAFHEHIVYGGPFVMNSEEEIQKAFYDYRRGLMGNI